jgi:hypothetical protein
VWRGIPSCHSTETWRMLSVDSDRQRQQWINSKKNRVYAHGLTNVVPLRNRNAVCFANAVFQLILRMDELVACIMRAHEERADSCFQTLKKMVVACSGSDPVDLEEYYIEWKLNFGREFHTLDTLDFREGLGGFPSLFLLALLRSFHGRCDAFDTRWLIDRRSFSTNMFEGRRLTYVDFMSMVLLNPVPCPYLIVYVAEHCIDVRGTELEWMNGCTINGVHMTIVAFTVKSLGHLSACVLRDGRWICIDDAELSKFDIPVIQDVFADAEMILVSLRAERYGPVHDVPPLRSEDKRVVPYRSSELRTIHGSIFNAPRVCKTFTKHNVDDALRHSHYTHDQLNIADIPSCIRSSPANVMYIVGPHLSRIIKFFVETYYVYAVTKQVVCTSPLRFSVAPGDAFVAVGDQHGFIARDMTLAARRAFADHAHVFAPYAIAEDSLPDRYGYQTSRSDYENAMLGKHNCITRSTKKYRKCTVVVFGKWAGDIVRPGGLDVFMAAAHILDVIFIPCNESWFSYSPIIFYALREMCVSHSFQWSVSVDKTTKIHRTLHASIEEMDEKGIFFERIDNSISSDRYFYENLFAGNLTVVWTSDARRHFETVPSQERAAINPPRVHPSEQLFDVPCAPCDCMWRQLLACDFVSAASGAAVRPWAFFASSPVGWVAPPEMAAHLPPRTDDTQPTIEIHIVQDDMQTRRLTSTDVFAIDVEGNVWFRRSKMMCRDMHVKSSYPHCLRSLDDLGSFIECSGTHSIRASTETMKKMFRFPQYPWMNCSIPVRRILARRRCGSRSRRRNGRSGRYSHSISSSGTCTKTGRGNGSHATPRYACIPRTCDASRPPTTYPGKAWMTSHGSCATGRPRRRGGEKHLRPPGPPRRAWRTSRSTGSAAAGGAGTDACRSSMCRPRT